MAVVSLVTDRPVKGSNSTLSPAKRAHVSGQYLDHLEKLKKLYETDILTKDEFEKQKNFKKHASNKLYDKLNVV